MSETAFILIVEKESGDGDKLADGLREEGHLCRIVHSRDDALESIRVRRPDVIVTDADLAGFNNGMELVRESNRLAPDAELIVLGKDRDQLPAVREQSGLRIYEYLAKPIKTDEFRRLVSAAIE